MNQDLRRKLDRITDILWAGLTFPRLLHQSGGS